jgi:hypothetical protein
MKDSATTGSKEFLKIQEFYDVNFFRAFRGGGSKSGTVADSLFDVGETKSGKFEKTDLLMMNNMLMARQSGAYGNTGFSLESKSKTISSLKLMKKLDKDMADRLLVSTLLKGKTLQTKNLLNRGVDQADAEDIEPLN